MTAPPGPPTKPPRKVGKATVAESLSGPAMETEIAFVFVNSSNKPSINLIARTYLRSIYMLTGVKHVFSYDEEKVTFKCFTSMAVFMKKRSCNNYSVMQK